MAVLRKIFGGIRMTWPRLILFAVISGVITGIVALTVPDGSSFRQIAVAFEAWIVLAILVVVNCEKPLESALKTFVYFLVSQPLVYLVQVPFNRMGFGLFQYYYPYWLIWTLATLPGGFIAWYIKRDDAPGAVVLSVALAGLILLGTGYLRTTVSRFPRFLVATLFCFGSVPVLLLGILHRRTPRLIAAGLCAVALAASLFLMTRNGLTDRQKLSFPLDPDAYPVTEEWTVSLADPDNGTVSFLVGDETAGARCTVEIIDLNRPVDIILTDPDGKTCRLPGIVEESADGSKWIRYWDD